MEKYFKKVRNEYNIRYIDDNNKWYKLHFNGKFTPSKPFTIEKDYGYVKLNIVDEGVFGLREI